MRIEQGEYTILDSGSLYSPTLENIKFIISENPLFIVECRVIQNNSNETSIDLEVVGTDTITVNFKNPEGLGYGITTPVQVGRYLGKDLYVTFHMTMKQNQSSFLLEYTFYTRESSNG